MTLMSAFELTIHYKLPLSIMWKTKIYTLREPIHSACNTAKKFEQRINTWSSRDQYSQCQGINIQLRISQTDHNITYELTRLPVHLHFFCIHYLLQKWDDGVKVGSWVLLSLSITKTAYHIKYLSQYWRHTNISLRR